MAVADEEGLFVVEDDFLPVAALDVVQRLLGGLVADGLLAGRAEPARPQRGPADLVAQRLAAAGARAPVGEQPQRAGQLAAGLRELVDEARRALRVGPLDDERVLGEVP